MIDSNSSFTRILNRNSSPDLIQLRSRFSATRDQLLISQAATKLEKPLAYWTVPNDRGLPLALLDRTVSDVLATPFEKIAATQGIGTKKLNTLLTLLDRIAQNEIATSAVESELTETKEELLPPSETQTDFDAAAISETQWRHWCDSVRHWKLESEKLGRLSPSLRNVPTPLWEKTLGDYVGYSLAELRQLRSYGEKRVSAVLSIFFEVSRFISKFDEHSQLRIRFVPEHITDAEVGIDKVLAKAGRITLNEVQSRICTAMLEQIQVDLGQIVVDILQLRLGIHTSPVSIYEISENFRITRARTYQHFESCARVMNVRWPEGNDQLLRVTRAAERQSAEEAVLTLLRSLRKLFFQSD